MLRLTGLARRLVLACLAVALLAGGPAMTASTAMTAGMAMAPPHAAPHTRHQGSTRGPHQAHGQCCDLCALHCGSTLVWGAAAAPGLQASGTARVTLPRVARPAVPTLPRYLLPPALAPPPLLA